MCATRKSDIRERDWLVDSVESYKGSTEENGEYYGITTQTNIQI